MKMNMDLHVVPPFRIHGGILLLPNSSSCPCAKYKHSLTFPKFEPGVITMALHVGMCQIFLRACWYWLSRRNYSTHLSYYSIDCVALGLLEPAVTTDLPALGSVSNIQYLYHQRVTNLTSLVRKTDRCSVYRLVDLHCHWVLANWNINILSSFVKSIDVWNLPHTKKQAETLCPILPIFTEY